MCDRHSGVEYQHLVDMASDIYHTRPQLSDIYASHSPANHIRHICTSCMMYTSYTPADTRLVAFAVQLLQKSRTHHCCRINNSMHGTRETQRDVLGVADVLVAGDVFGARKCGLCTRYVGSERCVRCIEMWWVR